MDEIAWKKHIKKVLVTFAKVFICTGIGLFIFVLGVWSQNTGIIGILLDYEAIKLIISISIGFVVIFIIFEAIIAILMYVIYKIKYSPRRQIVLEKEYIRELPKKYSPALTSLIYDLKIDIYKDYTATILYLFTKKYINIKEFEGKYKFEILKKDFVNLTESESYVLDKIINKSKFDEIEFSNKIIEEAKENFLVIDKGPSKVPKIIWFLLLLVVLFITFYTKEISLFLVGIFILMYVKYSYRKIITTNNDLKKSDYTKYKRTVRGKKLARELQAVKNYINEYTLISEKEINYIQILEEYIPYAISLGEANAIEKFIKYNEEYRSLIYDKKIDE